MRERSVGRGRSRHGAFDKDGGQSKDENDEKSRTCWHHPTSSFLSPWTRDTGKGRGASGRGAGPAPGGGPPLLRAGPSPSWGSSSSWSLPARAVRAGPRPVRRGAAEARVDGRHLEVAVQPQRDVRAVGLLD